MSMEVANSSKSLGQFASNKGYMSLVTLANAKGDKKLKDFFDKGYTDDVEGVRSSLDSLANTTKYSDVAETARELAKLIEGQEIAIITDGLTA